VVAQDFRPDPAHSTRTHECHVLTRNIELDGSWFSQRFETQLNLVGPNFTWKLEMSISPLKGLLVNKVKKYALYKGEADSLEEARSELKEKMEHVKSHSEIDKIHPSDLKDL
jgi:hypothetical protein